MIVQIYSITSSEEAKNISDLGVDHIGVMVAKTKGKTYTQDYNSTNKIFGSIPNTVKKVAFTKSNILSELIEICESTTPDILHISAFENISQKLLEEIKFKFPKIDLMKSIYVNSKDSIKDAQNYEKIVDFLLLDSQNDKSAFGATGKVSDWSIAREIVKNSSIPVILAGGLGVENVVDAIKTVHPAGVDSMTKTNLINRKIKDIEKIREFTKLAKSIS